MNVNAVDRRDGRALLTALSRDPSETFRQLWFDPQIAAPALMHVVAAALLATATVSRGAARLSREVDAELVGANGTVVTASIGVLVIALAPLVAVLSVTATAAVGHVVTRLFGTAARPSVSLSWVAVATLPLALRNALLGLAVALGGDAVIGRLAGLRFGDPFVVLTAVLTFLGARATLNLDVVPALATAVALTALPVAAQLLLAG